MGGFDENKADLQQSAFEFTKTVKWFSWGVMETPVAVLGLDSVIYLQQNGSTEDVRCKIIENVFV